MNLKIGFFTIAALFVSNLCFSQLSTRENTTSVFKTGSRPQAGSYGVYIGPSFTEISDLVKSMEDEEGEVVARGIPLINVKYYSSDNFEYRIGLQFSGKSTKKSGADNSEDEYDIDIKESVSFNRITPGIAYHFSSSNLLDVYVGAFLPLGWDTYTNRTLYDEDGHKTSKFSPLLGLGGFIGLQAFVADLPVSIGFEYGLTGLVRFGKQYKHTLINDGKETVYYTETKDEQAIAQYSKLNYSESSFGTDLRITFSYYFNR